MNKKGFVNIVLIAIVVLLISVVTYFVTTRQAKSPPPMPTVWQNIDADTFTISLPPSWEYNELQGHDSYVGEFVGDGAKLTFDYGWYSNPLAEDNDPNHTVTYETIGGYRAKIVVPKVTGNGTTGVYFSDLGSEGLFNLSGYNLTPSQQETALKIFRTIKFIK